MLSDFNIYSITLHDILSHLPNAFMIGMIVGYNLLFGYILFSECFCKPNTENNELINTSL